MKKAYLFPGQGSQKRGMGEGLFDEFPEITKKADEILGYSIKELCLNDPRKELNKTQFTQPALYVVNALSFQKKMKDGEAEPDFVAGHSLGEYNALQAAEVMSFEEGLKLVQKRGELMSKAENGGMAAVLNASEEEIQKILNEAKLTNIDIANLNSPAQIVISGLREDINKAQPFFEKANTMFIPLNTSGAFHSSYMKEAGKEFEKFARKIKFSKAKFSVIANINGRPYRRDRVAKNLVNQISNCVRWQESIEYILDKGDVVFEELGVGDVLTKLQRYIEKDYYAKNPDKKPAETAQEAPKPVEVKEPEEVKAAPKKEEAIKDTPKEKATTVSPKNKKQTVEDPEIMVAQWNENYSVGVRVKSDHFDEVLETRTKAVVLFGHRAAVYMKGYNGYFDLKEVQPVQA
ncbi:ACP S-malonyltransferase [Flavobacteriaceae bacterium M23B6Z8]